MSLTERELFTQKMYDQKSYEWLSVSGGADRPSFWEPEMKVLMKELGIGKSVVELGCGPATDGKYLLKEGCKNVISIDYSMGMLTMAKDVLKGSEYQPDLMLMDIYSLAFPKNTFDGFWASATLLHLESPDLALVEIKRITKPGGFGFISIKEGIGERVDSRTGYYFKYYSQPEFFSVLWNAGFQVIKARTRPNTYHNWLTFLVQKPWR